MGAYSGQSGRGARPNPNATSSATASADTGGGAADDASLGDAPLTYTGRGGGDVDTKEDDDIDDVSDDGSPLAYGGRGGGRGGRSGGGAGGSGSSSSSTAAGAAPAPPNARGGFSVKFMTSLYDINIGSFTSGMRRQLQEHVAATLGVGASRVELSASAGSVNVDVEVRAFQDEAAATSAAHR